MLCSLSMRTRKQRRIAATTDWFKMLNEDVIDGILSHLSVDELLPVLVVSKEVGDAADSHRCWRRDMLRDELPEEVEMDVDARVQNIVNSRSSNHGTRASMAWQYCNNNNNNYIKYRKIYCKYRRTSTRIETVSMHAFVRHMERDSKLTECMDMWDIAFRLLLARRDECKKLLHEIEGGEILEEAMMSLLKEKNDMLTDAVELASLWRRKVTSEKRKIVNILVPGELI